MDSSQNEQITRPLTNLLASTLIVNAAFLAFLLVSVGGFQALLSSNILLATFAVIILASLLTIWLIRKTRQNLHWIIPLSARLQPNIPFSFVVSLLGFSVIAGIDFLLFPAFEAYQTLVDIPRLYPLIAPAIGWLTTQAAILFIAVLVLRAGVQDEALPGTRDLKQLLLISFGLLILALYVSSIFIAWFAQRGFRLF